MKNNIAHKLTKSTRLVLFAPLFLFTIGTLSACGIKGSLKTPPPMWGDKSRTPQQNTETPPVDKPVDEEPDT